MKNSIPLLPTPAHLSNMLELNFTVDRSFYILSMKTNASGLHNTPGSRTVSEKEIFGYKTSF